MIHNTLIVLELPVITITVSPLNRKIQYALFKKNSQRKNICSVDVMSLSEHFPSERLLALHVPSSPPDEDRSPSTLTLPPVASFPFTIFQHGGDGDRTHFSSAHPPF